MVLEYTPEEYNAGMADTGMSADSMVDFARLMVESDDIPISVRDSLWGCINKEQTLSRTDVNERRIYENKFAMTRNLMFMCMPRHEVTFAKLLEVENAQSRMRTQINRSISGFERDRLTMQIKQIITNRENNSNKAGLWDGVKKKLGLGPSPVMQQGVVPHA